ncbi:uncharacterized protein LOC112900963 [Panicum hallii]|jgi:hypothetical protein|uniref:uncharacterized protein LOC112900963 n=1 Tax=Panicum hallii TaxID=206008 RepID=UPI000DF4D096|nr:uncharacterized protein LOC112900963 [Panicum hallii]XP_025825541.1 uncharacterized protein LOC112900963 [Panicum hallii]XP_025825542.1 uncharacterized protein LOC112900963 [Panicum hallii]
MEDKMSALKAYRRAKGLFYKCGEKWNPNHKCPTAVSLHAIEEVWQICSEPSPSDSEESDSADDLCALSLQAAKGTEGSQTIRLRGFVNNLEAFILVDSGSTHCFINEQLAMSIPGWKTLITPVLVKVANGNIFTCTHEIPELIWGIQGQTFRTTVKILPLGSYDMILGMDWLESNGPMQVHWQRKWMMFQYKGKTITLQGVHTVMGSPISDQQVQALIKNDSILHVIQLNAVDVQTVSPELPPEVSHLLQQFASLFEEPKGIPPSRPGDHQIPLLPGAQPFRLRPYNYNPAQKDEIEKQISDMLKKGWIQYSCSPFSSPILLVKKKTGDWRLLC